MKSSVVLKAKPTRKQTKSKNKGDIFIPILTVALSLFGMLAVYSASNYTALTQYGDRWYFVKKQLIGFFGGLILLYFCGKFDYTKLKNVALHRVLFSQFLTK